MHNADVLACNSQGKWSLDMAAPKSDVWHMLYKEIQWRSFLEQRRQCHLILVRASNHVFVLGRGDPALCLVLFALVEAVPAIHNVGRFS